MPLALGLPGVVVVVGLVSAAGHGLWSLLRDRRRRGRRGGRRTGRARREGGWGDVIADALEAADQPDDQVDHHRHDGGAGLDDHGGWHGHHDGHHGGGHHGGGSHHGGGYDGGGHHHDAGGYDGGGHHDGGD